MITNTTWTGARVRLMMVRGFQALVLVVPLIFTTAIHEYGTPKLIFAEVLIAMLAGAWVLSMVLDGEVSVVRTPLYYALLGLLAVGFASLLWAQNISQGLDVSLRQGCFFVLAVLVFNTVRSSEHIRKITGAMVVASGIVAVIGWLQHNGIYNFSAPWYLPTSTIGNANFVAQYYNAVFPIAVAMLFVERKPWAWAGIGTACLFIFFYLIILNSRGGWLGAAIGLSILGGMAWARRVLVERRWVDLAIPALILAGMAAAIYTGQRDGDAQGRVGLIDHLVDKYGTGIVHRSLESIQLADDSSVQRVGLWKDTARLIWDRPVLGVGLGNYEFAIPEFSSRESLIVKNRMEKRNEHDLMAFSAHNEYLEMWAETGAIGLLIFGVFLLQLGWALVGLMQRYLRGEVSLVAVGFAASVAATLSHAFFSSNFQQPASALHFWIAVGLIWTLKRDHRPAVRLFAMRNRKAAVGMGILCAALALVALGMGARTIAGEVSYHKGARALQQKEYAVAEAWYRKAAAQSPTRYYRIHQALGTALYKREKWDDAIAALRQSLSVFPHNERVHYLLGQALAKAGRDSVAIAHGRRAVALNPIKVEFLTGLGEIFLHFGRWADAVDVAKRATTLDSTDATPLHLLGRAHARAGHSAEAARAYQRALRIAPDDVAILNSLAVAHSRQGEFAKACDILERVLALAPDNADYRFNFATVQVGLKNYIGALTMLEQVIERAPEHVRAYQVMGEILSALGREEAAQRARERARHFAPNDPQFLRILSDME